MGINKYIQIGSKMKDARISQHISQKDMAKRLGLTVSTYSNYENNYREPKLEVIENVCKILGITIEELMNTPAYNPEQRVARFATLNNNEIPDITKCKFAMPVQTPLPCDESEPQLQTSSKQLTSHINRKNIILDTTIAEDNIINILLKKLENGKQLTDDESKILYEHTQYTMLRLAYLTKELEESLTKYYLMLNEAGQKKAHEEINRAISQMELLAKIPEYRNDTDK